MAPPDRLEDGFEKVQSLLAGQWREIVEFSREPHTVVVIPSLSLDRRQLEKIRGIAHYEERMLYLLLLLRQPRARVVLVTSQHVDPRTLDYVLGLLPGKAFKTARDRLVTFATNDWTDRALTEKVLERPWLLERIRAAVPDPARAHLVTFNMTRLEMRLAVALGIPAVGAHPRFRPLGTKSGSRKLFKEAGVRTPEGIEDLGCPSEIPEALEELWQRVPALGRAVVKLDDSFSGSGNAIFDFRKLTRGRGWPTRRRERIRRIAEALDGLEFSSPTETWEGFADQFREQGGIVEAFIEGPEVHSPSTQHRIDVEGPPLEISTHDQVLGGHLGQVYLGCTFPADPRYRAGIQESGRKVAALLREKGVQGPFSIDYAVVERRGEWVPFALEVNLRRGGTTHPFGSMDYLVDGRYDEARGVYLAPDGSERAYVATDNVERPWLHGLLPEDLHTLIQTRRLGFDRRTRTGSVFHMLGAASQFGKIGFTSIGPTPERAQELFDATLERLHGAADRPVVRELVTPA